MAYGLTYGCCCYSGNYKRRKGRGLKHYYSLMNRSEVTRQMGLQVSEVRENVLSDMTRLLILLTERIKASKREASSAECNYQIVFMGSRCCPEV